MVLNEARGMKCQLAPNIQADPFCQSTQNGELPQISQSLIQGSVVKDPGETQ